MLEVTWCRRVCHHPFLEASSQEVFSLATSILRVRGLPCPESTGPLYSQENWDWVRRVDILRSLQSEVDRTCNLFNPVMVQESLGAHPSPSFWWCARHQHATWPLPRDLTPRACGVHGFAIRASFLAVWWTQRNRGRSVAWVRAVSLLCYLFLSLGTLSKSLLSQRHHLRWDRWYLSQEVTAKDSNDNRCAWSPLQGARCRFKHYVFVSALNPQNNNLRWDPEAGPEKLDDVSEVWSWYTDSAA